MKRRPVKRGKNRDRATGPALLSIGIVMLLIVLVLASGCTEEPGSRINLAGDRIMTTELTDVRNGTSFSLSSFPDTPVLVQTFTTTCTVCMRQQAEITRLKESGAPFVMVGLDIDPNGNAANLRGYVEERGYYGFYAQSSPEMTGMLVDRFGSGVLVPYQAPLILICPDGSASLLPPGIKTADYLENALSRC